MIDVSIDVSITKHLIVFGTFAEDGLPISAFLGLLEFMSNKRDSQRIIFGN